MGAVAHIVEEKRIMSGIHTAQMSQLRDSAARCPDESGEFLKDAEVRRWQSKVSISAACQINKYEVTNRKGETKWQWI